MFLVSFGKRALCPSFTAARDIVDIVQTCQDNNALPESPQIVFAVSQAAFVCLYAAHFQHMDVGEYVHLRSGQSNDDHRTEGYMDLTLKILANMIPRLNMAKGHLDMLGKMQNYLSSANTEFQQRFYQSWSAVGNLKAYENFEKEFGSFHEMYESNSVCARTSINDIGKESVNADAMQGFEAPLKSATISKATIGESAQAIDHQQSPTQNSTLSGFVSPGESTLGINLFYPQHALGESGYVSKVDFECALFFVHANTTTYRAEKALRITGDTRTKGVKTAMTGRDMEDGHSISVLI
jgi:hypothetical protein